jgi:hypothetical protein
VGTKGIHLDSFRDINTNQLGLNGATTVTANRPYGNIAGTSTYVFAQINELETRQVFSYNALQVTAERRAHGLGFLASYAYSHALDEGSAESATVTNPYNLRYDYGNADYNVPNRFVASSNYQLPFKGHGVLGPLERGWQLNAIAQFFDGLPFSVASGTALGDGLTPRATASRLRQRIAAKRSAHAWGVVQHCGFRGSRRGNVGKLRPQYSLGSGHKDRGLFGLQGYPPDRIEGSSTARENLQPRQHAAVQ